MFSREEFENRCSRLLASMASERLDALVIFSGKPDTGYVRYYTGYEPQLGIQDCCFLLAGTCWTLFTNAFWDEPDFEDVVVTSAFAREVSSRLPAQARRVGIAPWRSFPAPVYETLHPGRELVDVTGLLLDLRAVKSPAEIELLRRIAGIADSSAEVLRRTARTGATELDIAAEVEYALRRAGSGPLVFSTILCSGPRTARFIALPSSRRVEPGDIVQLDCGPSLEGYHGDFSRVITAGSADRDSERLMEATAALYETCLAALRPGIGADHVACEVLSMAAELGYGPEGLYESPNVKSGFVGHGIGLANPDVPQLSPEDHTTIKEGMVINIETILRNPGRAAARIEDAAVIRRDGAERLSAAAVRLWET
ncbi:MAG TPA: Xaa-Pro peptidase family protein [Bryobacteraceae bacterium]|nr:Xaa-Pro peptidase family protein [Bryobacteraceae bacterium]